MNPRKETTRYCNNIKNRNRPRLTKRGSPILFNQFYYLTANK
nr:MAG TPA: hypothetical protein [Caudoviricetes sp.]